MVINVAGMEESMGSNKKQSRFWWLAKRTPSRRSDSPWLISTLSELEEKTNGMLKLIEEDADSFAKRAEMYYKKRPELVSMIEDFYRAHRSLAEGYDQLRTEGGLRRNTSSDCFSNKSWSSKASSAADKSFESSLDSCDSESEVDDPDPEPQVESAQRELPDNDIDTGKMKLSTEELEKLRQENVILKEELTAKDEAKREVIRQLSLCIDMLKEENDRMRRCIKDSKKSSGFFEFKKLKKGMFSGKLFSGLSKFQTTLVAI